MRTGRNEIDRLGTERIISSPKMAAAAPPMVLMGRVMIFNRLDMMAYEGNRFLPGRCLSEAQSMISLSFTRRQLLKEHL